MKLRNKKTGEVIDCAVYCNGTFYHSVNDVFEEWEDYEEPKEIWYIDWKGGIRSADINDDWEDEKQIGNYFETEEEAEKAVEKLKAWKRLKDKGFRFENYVRRSDWAELSEVKALENIIDITAYLPKDKIKENEADLNLLFGGEE